MVQDAIVFTEEKETVMRFADLAQKRNVERRQSLHNPTIKGFRPNRRGIMQKTSTVEILLRTGRELKSLGRGMICYADQDRKDTTRQEAEFVRCGVWNEHEVGWLWAFVNNVTYMLAKIDPTGATSLRTGFITEGGKFIIDAEKRTR